MIILGAVTFTVDEAHGSFFCSAQVGLKVILWACSDRVSDAIGQAVARAIELGLL
jgi:hypothetical protein